MLDVVFTELISVPDLPHIIVEGLQTIVDVDTLADETEIKSSESPDVSKTAEEDCR